MPIIVRDAHESELEELATLWYEAWRFGHEAVVPAELARRRTRERFRDRLHAALAEVRVAGSIGTPDRFSMLKGGELYQLSSVRKRAARALLQRSLPMPRHDF